MGRKALDRALAGRPHLVPLLEGARERLLHVIRELEPHVDPSDGSDPDLRFQIRILRQAEQEIGFMLQAEGATA